MAASHSHDTREVLIEELISWVGEWLDPLGIGPLLGIFQNGSIAKIYCGRNQAEALLGCQFSTKACIYMLAIKYSWSLSNWKGYCYCMWHKLIIVLVMRVVVNRDPNLALLVGD